MKSHSLLPQVYILGLRAKTSVRLLMEPRLLGLGQVSFREGNGSRILFIVDQLCEMGGAERVLLNMVRLLPPDRFVPQLVTFKIDPALGIFDSFPCPMRLLPLRRTWDVNAAQVAWKINRLIRRERIDIVHTFFETSDLWAGVIARLSGCRILISSRRDMGILRSAKHRLAYRLVNPLFNQIQTVSEQVRRHCIEQDRLPPDKVVRLYNGVAAEKAFRSRPRSPVPDATHLITTIAHIREVKGIDVFLRAAAKVRKHFPGAAFVVIGDNHQPEHHSELMRLREQLGLAEAVHFPGPVEDVFGVLKASDVFCLLSRSEGLSNALLEAMACELPCIATNVGGNPELVTDGYNGFLVEKEDPEAAAAAIVRLLRDRPLATQMGAHGRALVQRQFTTEAMIENLVRSYERLLDKYPA